MWFLEVMDPSGTAATVFTVAADVFASLWER